jgi:PLP dependent protein
MIATLLSRHMRRMAIIQNLRFVEERIRASELRFNISNTTRLVAVSKTKSEADILELYQAGQRHFGENYVQELISKAPNLPSDICWHFIGHLQSQKTKQLLEHVPNLYLLETVDSQKLAKKLDNTLHSLNISQLRVYIQVCTSHEETKSGVLPSELDNLLRYITADCPRLKMEGLMTIGSPGDASCFDTLTECRRVMCHTLGKEISDIALSMGMSDDFEVAIGKGSTSVRVGSLIFGNRSYPHNSESPSALA